MGNLPETIKTRPSILQLSQQLFPGHVFEVDPPEAPLKTFAKIAGNPKTGRGPSENGYAIALKTSSNGEDIYADLVPYMFFHTGTGQLHNGYGALVVRVFTRSIGRRLHNEISAENSNAEFGKKRLDMMAGLFSRYRVYPMRIVHEREGLYRYFNAARDQDTKDFKTLVQKANASVRYQNGYKKLPPHMVLRKDKREKTVDRTLDGRAIMAHCVNTSNDQAVNAMLRKIAELPPHLRAIPDHIVIRRLEEKTREMLERNGNINQVAVEKFLARMHMLAEGYPQEVRRLAAEKLPQTEWRTPQQLSLNL